MNKREAKITTRLHPWIKKTLPVCPWEVKHTRGATEFNIREIKKHQKLAMQACNTDNGFSFKMEDAGWHAQPFDGFFFKNTDGFFIIVFPTMFYAIRVSKFPFESKKLTESMALRLSEHSCKVKGL